MISSDSDDRYFRVLVMAPMGKDALLTQSILERAGVGCASYSTSEQVCAGLEEGAGAILLTEEVVASTQMDRLTEWLSNQPPWSDLPILVLAKPGADSAAIAEAMALLGNVTVLERPTRVAALVSAVRTALRARKRQYQIRDHLTEQTRSIESQSLLAAIVASSDDAIISKTLDGKIVSWNAGAERLFGYSATEVIGRSITILIPPERCDEEPALLARLRRGERIEHFETVRVTKDGRHLDISLTVSPVRGADGQIIAASKVARDISPAKRAAEALRIAQEHMQVVTNNMAVAVTHCGRDLRYRWVSPGYMAWLGRNSEEIIGKPINECLGDKALDAIRPYIERVLMGEKVEFETQVPFRDIGSRWVKATYVPTHDSSGQTEGWVACIVDMTTHHKLEEALREAQRVARVGSWEWDVVTDRSTASDELCDIFSLPAGRALPVFKQQDGQLYPHESWCQLNEALQETFCTGNDTTLDLPALRAGESIWVCATNVAVRDVAGTIVGLRGTIQDITDRKRLEEALRNADRRKDEFLAILAHELRNPLAPIRNSLHILRLHAQRDPTTDSVGEMMERQVNHLVRLVDDLMEVSRITRGQIELRKEEVEIAAIVRNAVETSKPLIDAGRHQLALAIHPEPLTLHGDPIRLAQVLANLLNNAAKYTEPGGQIWLTVKREGDQVAISIRDTGIGISAEMLPRVFDLFTQVDRHAGRAQGGLGIGLSLVKSLIEMHGGNVQASSEGQGRGSEFVVHLPLIIAKPTIKILGTRDTASMLVAPKRILVVDDNRDSADSMGTLLQVLGADVRVVYCGRDALEIFASHQPEVVLLDIGMPVMDGYEVARCIRQKSEYQHVVIIALTGWGQEEDRLRSAAAGFDHHLTKPANASSIQSILGSLTNFSN